ncbi:unnamed protein product (mitochondrion) [Plasmodiophora brassicae]|uniref:Radial spoke head protein 9 homolog n=1 Tax=Plasmodiophora brassicae TaxID=37360 RepID=A0A0G4IYR1_PLABS|nr:hypothetical protein PBRA_007978 [Plasmodiophora brassicae]SPQ96510.1 unnamed protein product [Plasmodiophora brassicae]
MSLVDPLEQTCLGRCLTPAEKLAARASLSRVSLDDPFGSLAFWGKIFGQKADYLVARSLSTRLEIAKKFYFSADGGKTFAELPKLDAWAIEKASKYHGQFIGDPGALLAEFKPTKPVAEGEEAEPEPEPEVAPRQMTELERLSWTVQAIDDATHIVIRGAYSRNAANDLTPSPTFAGLQSPGQLSDLRNYEHMRKPADPENQLAEARAKLQFTSDAALDSIQGDVPRGCCWTVVPQEGSGGATVHLRNLVWPGFSARVSLGSRQPEQAGYFGYGQRNQDLVFTV